eukprot:TRINITY_DN3814_c0_g1_i1.p1 TRINITY_DN3814_c0_g1~~TRINITY_DN3814_c0_g1_i1.p1  ORF type:complete len:320 (+),score=55.70 TRINITY_DN3814_c0_g1_i1:99-1058(+)
MSESTTTTTTQSTFPFTATKHKNPLGSYCAHAFQCNLKTKEGCNEETIGLPTFDALGYLCIPLIGVYGEEYQPMDPLIVLRLPGWTVGGLPWWKTQVETQLRTEMIPEDFMIVVHAHPELSVCQHFLCDERDEINIMPHPWLFGTRNGFEFGTSDIQDVVFMGVYDPKGVREAHQTLGDEEISKMNHGGPIPRNFDFELLAGAPFSRLGKRLSVVHWQAFSPNNGQLKLQSEDIWSEDCYTFYSLVLQPPNHYSNARSIVTFHVVIGKEKVEDAVVKAMEGVNDVAGLLKAIESVSPSLKQHAAQPIEDLLTKLQAGSV